VRFTAVVEITGLEGIADPEGQTVERALPALGFEGIEHVRFGKVIRFRLEAADEAAAHARVASMCDRLLANPVIEQASIRLEPDPKGSATPAKPATSASPA
jgi:phosphoribosylformylglycinamidine synthase PurS subunit